MSSFDSSNKPLLEMFIYETVTLTEQLDTIMLNSEKSGGFSVEEINEIFRIMHTIKGSSAMMGINNVSFLAHTVEDLFFLFREDYEKLAYINSDIFDLLFRASDYFKSEIGLIQSESYKPSDCQSLVDELRTQIERISGAQAPKDEQLHEVRVYFEEGCQMENIRAFMLLSQLDSMCELLDSSPQHPESDSSLSSKIAKDGLFVRFKTSRKIEDIYETIKSGACVRLYEILDGKTDGKKSLSDSGESDINNLQDKPQYGKTLRQNIVNVSQDKLDALLDIVGEIVIAESMIASNADFVGIEAENFNKSARQLEKLTSELQDIVMSMRMVPIEGVFQKMNRIVRDMSKKLGKLIELELVGSETEVDKNISDIIADPLMHMIRNSIDHAIESPQERTALAKPETGKIKLSAQNTGGEIVITVSDDGRGLKADEILNKAGENGLLARSKKDYTEKEIFSMIMLPGFSTKQEITEFSGRGVGMDVVRKNIEKVGGSISVDSQINIGTTFTIKIPLTLAIIEGMQVLVGNSVFTIPIKSIKQCFKVSEETPVILDTDATDMIMVRGECYPIIYLNKIFNIKDSTTELERGIIILIEEGDTAECLFVDALLNKRQVVVKPLPAFLNRYDLKNAGLAGCTILGDGSVSIILDTSSLLNNF